MVAGVAMAQTPAKAPSAAELVAARQAGFRLMAADFVGLKAAIDRGDDVKRLAFPAGAIAGWGKALPGLFPAGSATPESKALPSVWSDRAGFEAAAAKLAIEAGKLAELAKAGDTTGFAGQYQAVGGACKACHDKYRVEEKR
ncbi:MAG: hypothetical protein A4S16_00200 [Proteobacteria bacterium SG_bin6]|nr:MAG: hypothetical protein A4S16_00200 [Proteobacteria bacterium SG_bin6]